MGKAMLTLHDYQQEALKTSDETNTLEYCVLGLVNEAGEVAGVVKKWLRGDYDEAVMREKMLGELGDVLWYVAVTADRAGHNVDFLNQVIADSNRCGETDVLMWVADLIECSSRVLHCYRWGDSMFRSLGATFGALGLVAETVGTDMSTVAAHNIAKLRDRQERGVIRGSGDER